MSQAQTPDQNPPFGTDVSPEELDAILAANEADRNARAADKAAARASGQPEAGADELAAQLAELQAKNAELADLYLRAQADVQNARRRADEEMAKARKFAVEGFADSLLPALDSLEAGLAHAEATPQQIREGAEATLRQLKTALERNKVIEIAPAAGAKFDPHQHQAISVVPVPAGTTQDPNTIVAVLQKGYTIAERVLRPALVTVSAPK
jgi:molecular chaperone GrpE